MAQAQQDNIEGDEVFKTSELTDDDEKEANEYEDVEMPDFEPCIDTLLDETRRADQAQYLGALQKLYGSARPLLPEVPKFSQPIPEERQAAMEDWVRENLHMTFEQYKAQLMHILQPDGKNILEAYNRKVQKTNQEANLPTNLANLGAIPIEPILDIYRRVKATYKPLSSKEDETILYNI